MYAPHYLITLYLTSTLYVSNEDIYYNDVYYERRLLNGMDITRQLSDAFFQSMPNQTVTLEIDNADGYFSTLDDGGEEFRGKEVLIKRYDSYDTSETGYGEGGYGKGGYGGATPLPTFEFRGKITSVNLLDKASFEVLLNDTDPLQTKLPKKVLEDGDFGGTGERIVAAYRPSQDLGKPYPILFGHSKKVRCLALYFDPVADTYDFLIGYGTIASNNTNKTSTVNVYRAKKLVTSTEYTIYDGSQGIPYSGYAFIRFTNPQYVYDTSGSFYEIEVDAYGLEMGGSNEQRNFVTVIKNILADTTWGLSETVNATSFTQGANYVTNLLCDGDIGGNGQQVTAQSIINQLRYDCRAELNTNESGEWVIDVDHYQSWIDAYFGSGDGYYENIISINRNAYVRTSETVKNYIIKYGKNRWTDEYKYENTRTVNTFGEDQTVENDFIRNHETADRISCYYQRKLQYGKQQLDLDVGMAAEQLKENNIISVNIPRLKRNGSYRVLENRKKLSNFSLNNESYNEAIYTYATGNIPAEGISDEEADYSKTEPETPTALTLVSSGTYQASDGTTVAYAEFSAIRPSKNFARMLYGYKQYNIDIPYTYVIGNLDTGTTWKGKIDGLVPGLAYDFCARAENSFGMKSALATLLNKTAPGDTTAPSAPVGLAITAGLRSNIIDWTDSTARDLKDYGVYRNSTNVPAGATMLNRINASKYTDDKIGYVRNYYWITAFDMSSNESVKSATYVDATPSRTGATDVNFPWAGGSSAGGAATSIDNANCTVGARVDVYGDLYINNGQDIHFVAGGSTIGNIYASTGGMIVEAVPPRYLLFSGAPIQLGAPAFVHNLTPFTTLTSLGDSTVYFKSAYIKHIYFSSATTVA